MSSQRIRNLRSHNIRSHGVHSSKFAERIRRKKQVVLFLVILCVLSISAAAILLLRTSLFQVKNITIVGSTMNDGDKMGAVALASLAGNYFGIIPYSNTLFFSKKKIDETLTNDFKHIKSLSIHRSGISSLKIDVVERTPAAVVCSGFRDDDGAKKCYLSDEHGYIFGAIASSTSEKLNHYYIPTENSKISLGSQFLSEDRFKSLQSFFSGVSRGGLAPLGILIGDNGDYEMYVENQSKNSEVTIYFDDHFPLESTLENLLTFWRNSVLKKDTEKDFDYINLRFGNTVYYSEQ
jgi:hypothetical protein